MILMYMRSLVINEWRMYYLGDFYISILESVVSFSNSKSMNEIIKEIKHLKFRSSIEVIYGT